MQSHALSASSYVAANDAIEDESDVDLREVRLCFRLVDAMCLRRVVEVMSNEPRIVDGSRRTWFHLWCYGPRKYSFRDNVVYSLVREMYYKKSCKLQQPQPLEV